MITPEPAPSLRTPRWATALIVATAALFGSIAQAAEPEQVVVKNRLYSPDGHFELGVQAGFALVEQLVNTTNLQLDAAYNLSNQWAIEAMGGYALTSHTDLATQVIENVAAEPTNNTQTIDDFPGLWQIQWNAAAGVRWAPFYGKLNLAAEVPVHFLAYVAVGAGAAGLTRSSVTYCLSQSSTDPNDGNPTCANPLVNTRVSPIAEFGAGMLFYLGEHVGLKLELRDYAFPDQYQVSIQRESAQADNPTAGTPAPNPGFEQTVFMTVGLSYIF